MKTQNAKIKIFTSVVLAFAALTSATATTINDPVEISSVPPGAEVLIDGNLVGTTPFRIATGSSTQATNRIKYTANLHVEVRLKDYADAETNFAKNEVDSNINSSRKQKTPWPISFPLERVHLEVPIRLNSTPDGAVIVTNNNNQVAGTTPWVGTLVFNKSKSGTWPVYTIGVAKVNYKPVSISINEADAEAKAAAGFNLTVPLDEINRAMAVEFNADVADAMILINDVPAATSTANGVTTLRTNLAFTRANRDQQWPTITVRISKEGYEYRAADATSPVPEYVKILTADSTVGLFSAKGFQPVKFVSVPVRTFEIIQDKLRIATNTCMAALSQTEPEGQAPTPFHTPKPEDPLVLSHISPWPDHADRIVYARLTHDTPTPANPLGEVIGSHLCINDGLEHPMKGGRHFDVDPFVTANGKFIYYSSDRLDGQRFIWRMEATEGNEGTLPTQLTGNVTFLDTEPAVSADGTKLAYTSRPLGALPSVPSTIWIAKDNGQDAASTQEGRSPAWSPDGERIAYISPDDKICLMNSKGANLGRLTEGPWHDAFPVWTPSGKHIVFASDRAKNDRNEFNWDIWYVADDGSNPRQLTLNGSLDSRPAVSSDGVHTYVYFYSNRGAQKTGQESLQIFRLDLPQD